MRARTTVQVINKSVNGKMAGKYSVSKLIHVDGAGFVGLKKQGNAESSFIRREPWHPAANDRE
jgi:hypothetical protein